MSRLSLSLQLLSLLAGVGMIALTYWSRRRADALFGAGVGLAFREDTRAILDRAQRDARLQHAKSIEPATLQP